MKWDQIGHFVVPAYDEGQECTLSEQLSIHPILSKILLNRGVTTEAVGRMFLSPRLAHLRPPEGELPMAGFTKAADRLLQAILQQETVGIFGDYDVDGITTCALLSDFLQQAGASVVPRIADRHGGYGFGLPDAQALIQAGCTLVVTGDCGTSDHPALGLCKEAGIDVIIVDHHQVPEQMPDAYALLNPHQPGCAFPFKGLASVGVAFYLIAALRTRLKQIRDVQVPELKDFLDLVALGTIADLAPLTQENRILVTAGLQMLGATKRPGLQALTRMAGLKEEARRAGDVGYRLAPRLNAPGRLGSAAAALGVLLEKEPNRALAFAHECESCNTKRQKIQQDVFEQALAEAHNLVQTENPAVLVVGSAHWHPGVIGIVAAKLVDAFARPAVVLAFDGEMGRGSARTTNGFHLYQGLHAAADVLLKYGGHAAAAGLSIHSSQLSNLRERLNKAYAAQLGTKQETAPLQVDATLQLHELDAPLLQALTRLEPTGMGNPEPLFLVQNAELIKQKVVGGNHLQVTLRMDQANHSGIGFGLASQGKSIPTGTRVHAVVVPEFDTYQGVRRIRLRVKSLQKIAEPSHQPF